jgi:hypothetical protein
MRRPTFLQGVAVALIAALLGEVLFVALSPLLGTLTALQLVIASASFSYILYLLRSSAERTGRLVTLAAWLLVTVTTAWLSPPLGLYLLSHVAMIWLVRALYFHASLLTALADLGLNALAVAAVVWATLQSGSLLLALWCFFLVQALFVMIPPSMKKEGAAAVPLDNDAFEQARRTAQAALRKLSSVH